METLFDTRYMLGIIRFFLTVTEVEFGHASAGNIF